jgi:hypothetical protein
MNELCVRYPVVAAHNGTSAFAVACPEMPTLDEDAAARAVQSPVTIYNMSTGAKTHVLLLSRAAPLGSVLANPLAPVARVRSCATSLVFDLVASCACTHHLSLLGRIKTAGRCALLTWLLSWQTGPFISKWCHCHEQ